MKRFLLLAALASRAWSDPCDGTPHTNSKGLELTCQIVSAARPQPQVNPAPCPQCETLTHTLQLQVQTMNLQVVEFAIVIELNLGNDMRHIQTIIIGVPFVELDTYSTPMVGIFSRVNIPIPKGVVNKITVMGLGVQEKGDFQ